MRLSARRDVMSCEGEALELFEELLDLPLEEQRDRLAELGETRPDLCARVTALLRTEVSDGFLAEPQILHGVVKSSVGDLRGWQIADFELRERVGRGGQADVYKAYNSITNRFVALKVFHHTAPIEDEQLRPLHNANLHDPSIVTVYQAGYGTYGPKGAQVPLSWVAQQFVDSRESFASYCSKCTIEQVLTNLVTIAKSIALVHNRGVLHCDLKPDNVLIDQEGTPHIIDFDLARRLVQTATTGEEEGSSHAQGGTMSYMAPERLGQAGGIRDVSWDVYALGVMLYECLMDEHYIEEYPLDQLSLRIRRGNSAGLLKLRSAVDSDLADVVAKAVAVDPASRYLAASYLVHDLERCLERRAPSARRRPRPLFDLQQRVKRRPEMASMSLVLGVMLCLLFVVLGTDACGVQTAWQIRRSRALAPRLEQGFLAIATGDERAATEHFSWCLENEPGNLYATIGQAQVMHAMEGSLAAASWLAGRAEKIDDSRRRDLLSLLRERIVVDEAPGRGPTVTAEPDVELAALRSYIRAYTSHKAVLGASPRQLVWIADHLERSRSNRFGHSFFDYQYAVAASRSKRAGHLKNALESLRERWPDHPASLFYQGMLLFEQGEAGAALASFEGAAKAGIAGPQLVINQAHCLRILGCFEEAEKALGLEKADEHYTFSSARGSVVYDRGRFVEAGRLFARVVADAPWFVAAWHNLGTALAQSGDLRAAEKALARCLRLVPEHEAARSNIMGVRLMLGMQELPDGELDKALELFEAARVAAPGSPLPLFQLGVVYAMQGRYERAIDQYHRALSQDPGHVGSHENLIKIYAEKLGDVDALRNQLHDLRRVDPANVNAHTATLEIRGLLGEQNGVLREVHRWIGLETNDPRAACLDWLQDEGVAVSGEKPLEVWLEQFAVGIDGTSGEAGCWRLGIVLTTLLRLGDRSRARKVGDRLKVVLDASQLPPYLRMNCLSMIAEARR